MPPPIIPPPIGPAKATDEMDIVNRAKPVTHKDCFFICLIPLVFVCCLFLQRILLLILIISGKFCERLSHL